MQRYICLLREARLCSTHSAAAVRSQFAPTTWDIVGANVAAPHRYSGVGRGAVYGSTSPEALLGEMRHYGMRAADRVIVGTHVRVGNILDLTSPHVRKQLGVRLEDLTSDDYVMTNAIGDFARTRYRGLLVPSARERGTTNLVLFGDP